MVPSNDSQKQRKLIKKNMWQRAKAKREDALLKHMNTDRSELTIIHKHQRKESQSTAISMMQRNDYYRDILNGWNANDGTTHSQALMYEKGQQ